MAVSAEQLLKGGVREMRLELRPQRCQHGHLAACGDIDGRFAERCLADAGLADEDERSAPSG